MTRAKYRFVFFDADSALAPIDRFDEIGHPTMEEAGALGRRYVESLVDGAAATIRTLHAAGAHVHLLSFGIAQAVAPLAESLGVPARNTHAVAATFDAGGRYAGHDERSLLTRGDGKELVVRAILARSKGRSAFVADRSSGLPLKGVVDLVIDFGAVEDAVPARDPADVHVDNAALTAVLPYLIEEARAEPVRQ